MKKILFTLLMCLCVSAKGLCTQLPASVKTFVKEKFPEATIRFDGLIELPDTTEYLPVLPLVYEKLPLPVEVVQTIPADQDFSQKPDMILFSNNLALLKIIKKPGESPTVIDSPDMPLKVKLGILPQDLVVPKGLILAPELKIILGDLKIPLREKVDKEEDIAFYSKTENSSNPEKKVSFVEKTVENVHKIPELAFLTGKKLYTLSAKDNKLYVLDSASARVRKTITLPSVPFNMAITPDERYVLLAGSTANKIFVVDAINDEFVKTLDTGKFPSSIAIYHEKQKAYVANMYSSSISEIELKNMQIEKNLEVTGYPDNIQLTEDKHFIFYNDRLTGKVYLLDLKTKEIAPLFKDKNISELAQIGKYFLSLSRSENTLTVFDLEELKVVKKIETSQKPLDMAIIEKESKVLVVCAGSDELNIIDAEKLELIKTIPLKSGGFAGKIKLIRDKAIIANYDAYEAIIYDTDLEEVQGHIPVNHIIGEVVVSKE